MTVSVSIFLSSCDDNGSDDPPVLPDVNANIDDSEINFISDLNAIDGRRIKAGQSVTFKDDSDGDVDQWIWTFEGGPAAVNQANATVSWDEAVGQVMVILTVTRTADGATDADTMELQVGPVEMLSRAVYGLEDQDAGFDAVDKWWSWINDGTNSSVHSLEAGEGANGTSQSIKLEVSPNFGEFQLRPHEQGPEFLVSLKSNTTYVYSFYMKGSEAFTLSEAVILNDSERAEGIADEPWYTPLWTGDAAITDPSVTTSWKKFTYEFTVADLSTFMDPGYADGTADYSAPYFKHFAAFSGNVLTVWIDEMSIKEKE